MNKNATYTHDEWLQERRTGIGGSDAAADQKPFLVPRPAK